MKVGHSEIQKRKNISKKMIILGSTFGVFILLLFIFVGYLRFAITSPNSNDESTVNFVIEEGQGGGVIISNLHDQGLIKSYLPFILYINFQNLSDSLKAGEYVIAKNLTMIEVANIITEGNIVTQRITIPEGWTIEKIADRLAANNVVSKADFIAATQEEYDYWFLADKPASADLEGYLYPDTYEFGKNITATEIVEKMLTNFDKKFANNLRQKAESSEMTIHEIISLASIVEREVARPQDRKLVASVFLNRLGINMALESCATIQYITGENKTQFTYAETRIDNIYNTYIKRGLPPGPIGNPSVDSIEAVLSPQESDYLYFLSADGETYFSYTLDEHNIKKARYLD